MTLSYDSIRKAEVHVSLRRVGVMGALAILPAFAQQSERSPFWSGYVGTGGTGSVTDVTGSWTVPVVSCTTGAACVAVFWVGIDSYLTPNNATIEQIGIGADCNRGPTPRYYAWYEFYSLSFGVETLSASVPHSGPKADARALRRLGELFLQHGIKGKSYVMIGMPGQTRHDVFFTVYFLRDCGFTVRPTGYTPFHLLRGLTPDQLDTVDLQLFDRKTYDMGSAGLSRREFFTLLEREFDPATRPSTKVK
jgi:hypothetical protein